jgi:hypothetical protein
MVIKITVLRNGSPIFGKSFDTDGPEPFDTFRLVFLRSFAREHHPRKSIDDTSIRVE